jgi:phage baseplate assembly protein gpV
MKRLPLIALLTVLALPATAQASTIRHGVVLSIGDGGRQVQVVGSGHTVQAFRVQVLRSQAGRIARAGRIGVGSVISYRQAGSAIAGVRVTGHSSSVSYYASVIRASGHRLLVRLADGRTLGLARAHFRVSSSRGSGSVILAHAAAATSLATRHSALAAGTTVLVTESVSGPGASHFSFSLPSLSGASAPGADTGHQPAQG